jgi:hypothetical protein
MTKQERYTTLRYNSENILTVGELRRLISDLPDDVNINVDWRDGGLDSIMSVVMLDIDGKKSLLFGQYDRRDQQ